MANPDDIVPDLREQLIEMVLREAGRQALSGDDGRLRRQLIETVDRRAGEAAREALARQGGPDLPDQLEDRPRKGGLALSDADVERIADAVAARLAGGDFPASPGLIAGLGRWLDRPPVRFGLYGALVLLGAALAWFVWLKPDPVNPAPRPAASAMATPSPEMTIRCDMVPGKDGSAGDPVEVCQTTAPPDGASDGAAGDPAADLAH